MTSKQKTIKALQAELDEIIIWFESDEVDVDEAIDKFKHGQAIVDELRKRLDAAELTITKLQIK